MSRRVPFDRCFGRFLCHLFLEISTLCLDGFCGRFIDFSLLEQFVVLLWLEFEANSEYMQRASRTHHHDHQLADIHRAEFVSRFESLLDEPFRDETKREETTTTNDLPSLASVGPTIIAERRVVFQNKHFIIFVRLKSSTCLRSLLKNVSVAGMIRWPVVIHESFAWISCLVTVVLFDGSHRLVRVVVTDGRALIFWKRPNLNGFSKMLMILCISASHGAPWNSCRGLDDFIDVINLKFTN